MDIIIEMLPVLIPLFVLQIGFVIFALLDLRKRNVKYGNKLIWALIIIFVNLLGPVIYFLVGRDAYADGSDDE